MCSALGNGQRADRTDRRTGHPVPIFMYHEWEVLRVLMHHEALQLRRKIELEAVQTPGWAKVDS